MKQIYYLLWNSDVWGVYDKNTCPDSGAFPNSWYKKYLIDTEKSSKLFEKLMAIKEKLVKENVIPSKNNYKEIFPELEGEFK